MVRVVNSALATEAIVGAALVKVTAETPDKVFLVSIV